MDALGNLGWLCFGLAFFTWTIRQVRHQDDVDYDRKLNERREFGYGRGTKYHPFRRNQHPED